MTQIQLDQLVGDLYANDLGLQPCQDRLPDPEHTRYNHFYARSQNSGDLLLCVGDSYTKGVGLESVEHGDQSRLDNMFGTLLSRDLGWDHLNMGGSGYSNSWCFVNIEYVLDWLNTSDYKSGAIVLTLTENGRDIKNFSHRQFNYLSRYRDACIDVDFYDLVCDDIEEEWTRRLLDIRHRLDTRFAIVCGCNFVWHQNIYDSTKLHPGIDWQTRNWIEVLADYINIPPPPRLRYAHMEAVQIIDTIMGITDTGLFKQWFLRYADTATKIMSWMSSQQAFFEPHDLGHPNALGHRLWADAIKKLLTENHKGSES